MKPRKPITVPVAGRVSPEVQEWILEGADLHQMSTSEFVGQQLALAAQKRNNLEALRQEKAKTAVRLEEAQQELAWYKAFPRRHLEVIRRNVAILAGYFEKHGKNPIAIQELVNAGYNLNYLLCTQNMDGKQGICLGRYSWYYTSPQKTHLCIVPQDGNHPA